MRTNILIQASVFAALVTFGAAQALASPIAFTSVTGTGLQLNGTGIELFGEESIGYITGYSIHTGPGAGVNITGTTSAHARASAGSLGADAYATVDYPRTPDNEVRGGYAQAVSRFTDTLTISAGPGLSHTMGSFIVPVAINGAFTADAGLGPLGGSSDSVAYIWLVSTGIEPPTGGDPRSFVSDSACVVSSSAFSCSGPVLNTGVFSSAAMYFFYDEPFTFTTEFTVFANASSTSGTSSFASITMMNSADLQGITAIRDAAGNIVTGFSVVADSGADYTKPFSATAPSDSSVPEPATLILLGTGLAALGRNAKHRLQRSEHPTQ